MKWKTKNIKELAHIICGDKNDNGISHFMYRSSSLITAFFKDCDLDYVHDGTTRWRWVADRLEEILALSHPSPSIPSGAFIKIIRNLLDKGEAQEGDLDRSKALTALNVVLTRQGWTAFYDEHGIGQLRHLDTNTIAHTATNPHRPLTPTELERKEQLIIYLDSCSEDNLIEEILLPLFRHLGFQRVTAVGHKDKALEFGTDVWMKYTLPTLNVLYFGIQVKKGKLDSAGISKNGSSNIAEILNQVTMLIGHEIFDPEVNRKVLVDHAFIIAGGEITKQARLWVGSRLDSTKRSQVMFLDRNDIINLFFVNSVPLPKAAISSSKNLIDLEDIPF